MIDGDILFSFAGGDERHIDFLPEKCQSDFFLHYTNSYITLNDFQSFDIASFINFFINHAAILDYRTYSLSEISTIIQATENRTWFL